MLTPVTLLVSALTQDCVWQVADRRLTNVVTGCTVSTDTNKAVHFARSMLFAFTGPAELEGTPTATWVADRLSVGTDADDCVAALLEGLERAIAHVRPDLRAFAVDGVGWGIDRRSGAPVPHLLRISTCIDAEGIWTGTRHEQINMWSGWLKPHAGLNMRPAGQPVPAAVGQHWERQIRRRLAGGARSSDIGRCLVQLVRDVAANNKAVGQGVLVSAIPRRSIERPSGLTLASMPHADHATFKYFPEGTLDGVDKGPEVAGPSGHRMSNFVGHTDGAGNQWVQVDIRMPEQPGK